MATFGDFPPSDINSSRPTAEADPWERKVLQDLAFAAIKEQRASRRWGYVFKGFILLYLVAILVMGMSNKEIQAHAEAHTALVEINGVIAADAEANADTIVTGIRDAFESHELRALSSD